MNGVNRRKQCFVIGPYGDAGTKIREWSDWILEEVVKPAAEKEGYWAVRTIDEPRPGDITARIMQELRTADLVVADLTGSNPNVYYELALRHAKAKPFIHLARVGTEIPFDVRVMEVIYVAEGKDAEAREQLREQISAANDPTADFWTAASGPRPVRWAKVYTWRTTYAPKLASMWLERQDEAIRDTVRRFTLPEGGGPPQSQELKNALIEYLQYRGSVGTRMEVDLYYAIDGKTREFSGWGIAPPALSRAEPLLLRVSGNEDDGGRKMKLMFDQPGHSVKLSENLEGWIRSFSYTIWFETSAERAGVLVGKFNHPEYDEVLVGTSELVPQTD